MKYKDFQEMDLSNIIKTMNTIHSEYYLKKKDLKKDAYK